MISRFLELVMVYVVLGLVFYLGYFAAYDRAYDTCTSKNISIAMYEYIASSGLRENVVGFYADGADIICVRAYEQDFKDFNRTWAHELSHYFIDADHEHFVGDICDN